jgi:rubrerythrin
MTTTRRQLIGRGIGIAGAAAIPTSLLAAPVAFAQEDEETDALERMIELEQAAELAYSLAAENGDLKPDVADAFELFKAHCGDHDTALSEALDQLGVDPPGASSDPADYERLADFDDSAPEKQQLEFIIGLEEELIQVYQDEIEALDAEDLVRSAAQIGGSHAQMWVVLNTLADGRPPTPADLP